jgi:hypothetical protein
MHVPVTHSDPPGQQTVPHLVPAAQAAAAVHTPATQVAPPPPQSFPHTPQLEASLVRSLHANAMASPVSQACFPAVQEAVKVSRELA